MRIGIGISPMLAGVLGGDAGVALGVGSDLQRLLALSPSLVIWPANGAGWQGTSGGTLAASGQPLGLGADLSQLQGKTLGEWLATAPEKVTNGTFDADTSWTKGTDWSIGSGVASKIAGVAAFLSQSMSFVAGRAYVVTFTATVSAGTIQPQFSTTTSVLGAARASSGTYTEIMVAVTGNDTFRFLANSAFAGSIDDVSVKELPGNHLRAGTWASPSDAARGTYGRVPLTGRRNLLLRSQEFATSPWGTAIAGTGTTGARTNNFATAPDGTATATRVELSLNGGTTAGDVSRIEQSLTIANTTAHTLSFWVRLNTGSSANIYIQSNGVGLAAQTVAVTSAWQRVTFTATSNNTSASVFIGLRGTFSSDSVDLLLWGAQLEAGSTATAYQRVVDAFDVTEAGVPDTYYTSFDGSSDYYSLLNAISITTNMTVVRAFKRATTGINTAGIAAAAANTPHDLRLSTGNIPRIALGDAEKFSSADATTGSFVASSARNASAQYWRLNGTQVDTAAAPTVAGSFNAIGRRNTDYNSGEISFLAVFPTELTGADLALVEQIAAATNGAVVVWFLASGAWNEAGRWFDEETWT